ncbi:hypothetical protein P22_1133 [Propionispora sp. 2/2-37]|uniref:MurR/RpiR family transcriptional regulator n=1 Tax=Propionispora sp. 2/2-37 TaxID=1677858 RepID=UPI0006BB5815|nr:MurR/RpiR family transcriptional regulator [Propionispora sp. 2/2-37]CUH95064.1 hypothetical protein P22_1133 [Propionispora sp. 2/2-37]
MNFEWDVGKMSPKQQKIADFIQKNQQRVLFLTEQQIADELQLSIASVSRFWKAVGYKNLKDFKSNLHEMTVIPPANKLKNFIDNLERPAMLGQMLEVCIHHLQETLSNLSASVFEDAVEAFALARRVYLYGPGPSEGIARLMQFRMARFGIDIRMMPKSGHELYESLMHVSKEDLVVVICFVQLLPETMVLLEHAQQAGYRTLLITDRLVGDFIANADLALFASRGELWEFHSMVAPTFLVEALTIGLCMRDEQKNLHKLDDLSRLRKRYADLLPK